MENPEITQKVINCGSFAELVKVLRDHEPFVSYSRPEPKSYSAEEIISRVRAVTCGDYPLNYITRVNGLRAKVAEFIHTDNYGRRWGFEEHH